MTNVQPQPGANVYTQGFGSRPENVEVPHLDVRAPASTDTLYPVGKNWVDTNGLASYVLVGKSTSNGIVSATWAASSGGTAEVSTLTGDSGTATPVGGNIKIAGTANQIVTSGSGSTVTLALTGPYTPATYTAHGVLVGEGTSSVVAVAPSSTSGVALISQGASADPAYGTVVVAGGGTGAVTLTGVLTGNGTSAVTANAVTQHGVVLGGAANAVSSLGVAATGTVLAGSTGADPAFTGSPSVSGSLTAATTITATLGNITATNGNVVLGTAGNKLVSTSVASTTTAGANSFGTVTLSSGTATISTTAVTANSIIMLTRQSAGSTGANPLGMISVGTITGGTSFVINALTTANSTTVVTTDASVIGWMIIN